MCHAKINFMKTITNNLNDLYKGIYLTTKNHYLKNELDIDELIKRDVHFSVQNKNEASIYKRLVLSIHNANWKAVSQETFCKRKSNNYEVAFNNYNAEYASNLYLNDLKNKGLINSDKKLQYCIDAAKFIVDLKLKTGSNLITFFKTASNMAFMHSRLHI